MTNENLKFAGILVAAFAAAEAAANAANAQLPPEAQRGFDCGFAWVDLPTATTPFARHCRKHGIGSKHWRKGWQFWSPAKAQTQSVSVHEAGARAFAEVLTANGIDAYAGSRLD